MGADRPAGRRPTSVDEIRAAALARQHFSLPSASTVALPGSSVAIAAGRAVAVLDEESVGAVGGALLWVQREQAELLAVVVDRDAARIEAWLAGFAAPPPVLALRDRELVAPEPRALAVLPADAPIPPELTAGGLEVVVENGIVRAEVLGLEVARVVVTPDGATDLQVGVGEYDRAAHKVMTATRPSSERLAGVVDAVSDVRRPGAPTHVFNRLCRERWLRSQLMSQPEIVGLDALRPVEPVPARDGLTTVAPAPAVGVDPDGATVLVMASVGVDPGLPVSTSAVSARERADRIVVAQPERDRLAPVAALLERLAAPADVVGVAPPWV